MSMRDAFSGLFPANVTQGVSGVSGVAKTGIIRKSNTPPDPSPCNTSITPNAAGVSSVLAATPFALPHHGMGVSNNTKQIQSIVTTKTPETPETPETPHDDLPDTDFLDMFHERAAIVEYDGKFPRHMADAIAYWDTFLQFVTNRHPTIRAEFDAILNAHPFH
ncbi:MAG: hypothetical protein FGM23_05075 [Alphaproteobacteria bacterium]|nr:hypothetical protein [Alphaproteobacteria bacterium]